MSRIRNRQTVLPLGAMTLVLKRSSLVAQVLDAIRAEILRDEWKEWIPSERELSRTLHVSRNTCRAALRALRQARLIEPVRGCGYKVNRAAIRRTRSTKAHVRSVGLVVPDVMSKLRPRNSLFIDELRKVLYETGVRVDLHCSPTYYANDPRHALEKLVAKNRHDCWVLMLSREPLQRWFIERQLPSLVLGSVYANLELPSVDLDYRAICRHAAGTLIGLGHRRLAFLNRRSRAAGDLRSEEGFLEGVRASSRASVDARVVYHDDDRKSVSSLVHNLLLGSHAPTGLLVANSYAYLSAVSALARHGLRIPADVSLISRDDDPFLAYVDPEPARYLLDSNSVSTKVMHLLTPLLEGRTDLPPSIQLFPSFSAGESCKAI